MTLSVGIIGASGYTGAELLRILETHPSLEVRVVTADTQAGKKVNSLYPHLVRYGALSFLSISEAKPELEWCDIIFSALPHGEGKDLLPTLKNRVIIDLSNDFRFSGAPWRYGLPELFRDELQSATRIANPGCYATAAILASAPLVKNRGASLPLHITGVSGLSGAGRAVKDSLHGPHIFEDVRAYKVVTHQHTAEIEKALSTVAGSEVTTSFVPHLGPYARGIHITVQAKLETSITQKELFEAYRAFYEDERFVSVSEDEHGTKEVRGANRVFITPTVNGRLSSVVITAVIDNLVKGAAGQAIQNANIALGFDEALSLTSTGLYP